MTAVFKTKLRPRFSEPFTVMTKKGLAYTLNLLRKLRTHPVFYVGMLKPYRDPSHVDLEALAPRKVDVPLTATSESRHPTAPPVRAAAVPAPADASAPLQARSESEPTSHGDVSLSEPSPRALAPIQRPPPMLLDEQKDIQFHVEIPLQKRSRHDQHQYLAK